MPTLSFDGFVYHSDALERRQLVRVAPSVPVTHLIQRVRTTILAGEQHDIDLTDLPDDKATAFLLAILSGEISLTLTDGLASQSTYSPVKMTLMLGAEITAISITGIAESSVYDMIAAGDAG